MADLNLTTGNPNLLSLNVENNNSDLEIDLNTGNIVKDIIPDGTNITPDSDSAYMNLFGTYIQFGTSSPDSITDKRCRIYIKY